MPLHEASEFDGLRKQGLRVTVDVFPIDDDGHTEFDQASMMPSLSAAVDKALETMLLGSYATYIKVTRIVG